MMGWCMVANTTLGNWPLKRGRRQFDSAPHHYNEVEVL